MSRTLYNNLKTALFLGLLTGLMLAAGAVIGGREGLLVALAVAGVMNFTAYFFSDKIALASMGAVEVGPEHELYQITADLAARADLPMPRVYVSPHAAPNAFATGRNPRHAAVCATAGLLQLLDREEIAGVMAHELAHVKHRDILTQSVAATIGGAVSALAQLFMFGGGGAVQGDDGDGGGGGGGGGEAPNPLFGLLILVLGPVAAALIQAAISRSREFNADTVGARICGNPMWLASALEKLHATASRVPMDVNPAYNGLFIVEPLTPVGRVAALFQTHPPVEDRLVNLIGRPSTGLFPTLESDLFAYAT